MLPPRRAARASTFPDLTRPLALGLLLLALVLRAVIPAGYMPDAEALRQGMWRLGFCAVNPAAPIGLGGHRAGAAPRDHAAPASALHAGSGEHGQRESALHPAQSPEDPGAAWHHAAYLSGDPHAHPPHEAGSHPQAQGMDCPFFVAAHLALHLPGGPALAGIPARQLFIGPARAWTAVPPSRFAGPPLGSRAPPRA